MTAAAQLNLHQLTLLVLGVFVAGYLVGQDGGGGEVRDPRSYSDLHVRRMMTAESDAATAAVAGAGEMAVVADDARQKQQREVHVGVMCRCKSRSLPVPGPLSADVRDTSIVQQPYSSMKHPKRFLMHEPASEGKGCSCLNDHPDGPATTDVFLQRLNEKHRRCSHPIREPGYEWNAMPDLAVETSLPLFVGVLSYESPMSLRSTLGNWKGRNFFRQVGARGAFVQLNHRSVADDSVMEEFAKDMNLNVMGSPDENLHPGLAIAKMCRAAEAHPESHPEGENLLMFLEKDWQLRAKRDLGSIFRGINALVQRGVPYVRLSQTLHETDKGARWSCPSEGVPFTCTTAHNQRWTNLPLVVSCPWFLRYLEPYALLDDPIMHGCRPGMQENGYCDWEEAMQDGRVAWSNSQWVVANVEGSAIFQHKEVDM